MKKVLLILLAIALSLGSACQKDVLHKYGLKNGQKVTIKGTIYLVGNAPFTQLAMNYQNTQVIIVPKNETMREKMNFAQNTKVTVKGKLKAVTLRTKTNKYIVQQVQVIDAVLKK